MAESSGMVPRFGAGKRFMMYTDNVSATAAPHDIKEVIKQITNSSKKPRQRYHNATTQNNPYKQKKQSIGQSAGMFSSLNGRLTGEPQSQEDGISKREDEVVYKLATLSTVQDYINVQEELMQAGKQQLCMS